MSSNTQMEVGYELITVESSSDSEGDENDEEIRRKIQQAKNKILEDELHYDSHVVLVGALRTTGDLEELRQARQHFSKIYPLSPDLWMDWLTDEQAICTTPEERTHIVELFEKAVKSYISVKVWVEYIMFMLGSGEKEATRQVCDRALTAVGIHFAEGLLVWQAILLVEQQVYSSIDPENSTELVEQKKFIQNLYRRQARVPLLNTDKEEFVTEASVWFDNEDVESFKRDLEQSIKKSREKVPFEDALRNAEDDTMKLEAYRKYLDFVIQKDNKGNPTIIQNIYERATTDLCLNHGMWEEYVRFAMDQFPFAGYVILPICERSQQNCPWSVALCELHMRAIEKFSEDDKLKMYSNIKDCLEKTLTCVSHQLSDLVMLWMTYLVSLRREINWEEEHSSQLEAFTEACQQATTYIDKVTIEGDPDCSIPRFQACIAARCAKNIEMTRSIYNDIILKKGNNFKRTDIWLEFINLERDFGNIKHARKLYRRALERIWDDVELIGKEFQRFEQENGSLETLEDFEKRYRHRLSIVQKVRLENAKEEVPEKDQFKRNKYTKEKPNTFPSKPSQTYKADDLQRKRAFPSASETRKDLSPQTSYKRSVEESISECSNKKAKIEPDHGEFFKHDVARDHRTVFLSNVDYNIVEEEILPIFADCGPVETLRLAKDFKGRSKGFGFLVFKNSYSVQKAIKCDRTPIGKRPIFISECDVNKSGHTFQYATNLEKSKLFVKGLPFCMEESQVKEAFLPHGKIKSLRLITQRSGFSKGCCYIEYYNANDAEAVRKEMDGKELEGMKITVLISDPSHAKISNPSHAKSPPSIIQDTQMIGQRPKRLDLMPRALVRKMKNDKALLLQTTTTTANNIGSASTESESPAVKESSKTNDDFRKMFLK